MTPPAVSRPRLSGVTSSSSRSCTFSLPSPLRMAAWSDRHHVSSHAAIALQHHEHPVTVHMI